MNFKRWWGICCCWGIVQMGLFAQKATISGYIEDAETGERILGANIFDPKTGQGTSTNLYGFYSLTLPQSKDTTYLTISYIGLQTKYFKLVLDKDATVDFQLSPNIDLQTVEVVAEDTEPKIEDRNQMSQISIPMEQIKTLPAFLGEVDVLKAIQLLPGVQSGEGNSGLYVRGGSPDQNLILLDGVPVYNVYHLFGFFSVFNGDAIKSVQLTKGGYPARFGGRLSSVLEINMKEGNMKKFKGEGSIGLISSKITLEAPIWKDRTSFIVSARRTYLDVLAAPLIYMVQKSQGVDNPGTFGYYFYDINAKINHIFNPKNRIYLSFYAGDDKFHLSFKNKLTYPDGTVNTEETKSKIQWGNLTSALRWNHLINNKLFANMTLTYSRYNFLIEASYDDITKRPNQPQERTFFGAKYLSGIEDLGLKVDFDYSPNPNHYVRFGANGIFHTFKPGATTFRQQIDTSNQNIRLGSANVASGEFSVYVEDDIRIGKKFGMNIGGHVSAFVVQNKTYYSAQPRMSMRYMLPYSVALKGSFATMTQYIHLLSNEGIGLPTDLWVPSTNRVAPERSWQAALGLAKTFKGGYELSVEGYYRRMTNLLSYLPGATFLDLEANQTWEDKIAGSGKGWAYGAELFLQKQKGKFTGWLGYTLAWNFRQFEGTEINSGRPYPFKYDRRHNISLTGVYDLNERISLSAAWVYGTGNSITLPTERYLTPSSQNQHIESEVITDKNSFRMRAYHRMDVAINIKKQRKKFLSTWSFGVYNLYNRQNPFFIFSDRGVSGNRVFKQVALFPIIPSIRWDFKF